MNSQAETPILDKVTAEVESVDIRTMPYTNAGSGYTRLTIRTYPNVQMSASSAVLIPAPPEQNAIEDKTVVDEHKPQPLPNIPTTVKEQSTQSKPDEHTKIQENESTTTNTAPTARMTISPSGVVNVVKSLTVGGTAVSLNGHTHDYAASSHSHNYLPTEQVSVEQNTDAYTWIRGYALTDGKLTENAK